MEVKCRVCLASSEAKLYHSLASVFPLFLKSRCSVLEVLQTVTSSTVLISPGWPDEICTACLKSLKECHIFIQEFEKAQTILSDTVEKRINAVFIKAEEEIILKIEPADEDFSDPLLIKSQSNDCSTSEIKLAKRSNADQKVLLKNKKISVVKKKVNKRSNSVSKCLEENERNEADVRITEHNYTKSLEDSEADSENPDPSDTIDDPEMTSDTNAIETIEIINTAETSGKKPSQPLQKVVVMSVDDVLNVRRKYRRQVSPVVKPKTKSKIAKSKLELPTARIKPKDNPLKALVTKRIQSQTKKLVETGQVFNCSLCFKAYSTPKGLSLHKYVHTPAYMEDLKCKHCGHQSNSKSAFIHHRQKHDGNTYKCDECGKIVFSKWQVMEHKRRMHGGGLPEKYMCNECGKRFKYNSALKYHIIATHHKEDKEYLCGFCGYKCVTKAYLKRHERCHTDERPYKCKFCPKSFRGSAELQSHHLVHEQKTRYCCRFCGKGYITAWNMRVHWLQHDGNHACELCSKSFADDEVLKFHYYFRHKIRERKPKIEDDEENEEEEEENDFFEDHESVDNESFVE